MQDIYEKTIEDLGGLMIKFFGCDRITMPIQQAIVLLEAHQQIIRCKDCKYHAMDMCCNHPIEWNNGESRNHCNPNWFCADGERKNND